MDAAARLELPRTGEAATRCTLTAAAATAAIAATAAAAAAAATAAAVAAAAEAVNQLLAFFAPKQQNEAL